MPGAGKSFLGKRLANKLGYNFIDLDIEIEKVKGKSINKLLEELGDKELLRLEETEAVKLKYIQKTIISPGGSIIYSKKAMELLKENSIIIFLNISLNEIKNRIKNLEQRGIVGLKEKGIDNLYLERTKLYKHYADIEVNAQNLSRSLKTIIEKINSRP